MTEYATDPETIQEYLNSRERCANWVNIHSQGLSYVSPSSPPSILSDDDTPMYGPSESDASSSHSLPPRMLLRYDDGRPDIPISQDPSPTHSRGQPQSSRHRSRSGSFAPPAPAAADVPHHPARYAQTLSYASGSRYAPTGAPENIRVLPSRQAEDSQRMPASTSSSHRSRAPPPAQGIFQQPSIHDRVPPLADHLHTSNRSVFAPTPRHATTTSAQPIPVIASPTHSHPAPGGSRFYEQPGMAASTMQNGLPYHYAPPAIVYAPSGRHASKYQPPAIVYSPSSHGTRRAPAPGIAYSRSDPLPHPTQYSPVNAGSTPFPPVHGSSSHHSRPRAHSTAGHEQSGGRTHGGVPSSSRSRTRTRTPSLSPSDSDTSSDTSGSTYYVLPSPGQKVQIIVSVHISRSLNVVQGSAALSDLLDLPASIPSPRFTACLSFYLSSTRRLLTLTVSVSVRRCRTRRRSTPPSPTHTRRRRGHLARPPRRRARRNRSWPGYSAAALVRWIRAAPAGFALSGDESLSRGDSWRLHPRLGWIW